MMRSLMPSVRRPRSWALYACLALLVLALAACGSGNVGSSGSPASAGNSSGANPSVMTISIKENPGVNGGQDAYFFDPTSITLNKGDTITIQNRSDEMQDIDQGDAQKAGVDVAIPINQSATMTFSIVGTFTIKSEKGATITVTVQ